MSAALGPAVLRHSEVWRERVDAWTERIAKHESNLVSYLIVLRCVPSLPRLGRALGTTALAAPDAVGPELG